MNQAIERFLQSKAFAVIGTSRNQNKFGNKILRTYLQNQKIIYPVHPIETEIEGMTCYKTISELPEHVNSLSIVTPPHITEKIIDEAYRKGIQNIWMQPGAESKLAIQKCKDYGINFIAEGECLLVVLGFPS